MFDELEKYKDNGHFFYESGTDILKITQNLPNIPGLFYILRLAYGKIDLVYVGNSDSTKINNKPQQQSLRTILSKRKKGMRFQDFLDRVIEKENIDALDIYWFVTDDDDPSDVANEILQNYYDFQGTLPMWNKSF